MAKKDSNPFTPDIISNDLLRYPAGLSRGAKLPWSEKYQIHGASSRKGFC